MNKDIYPRIGRLPIRSVTAALNLRQWCSQVFRYAVATLRADHGSASALRGAVTRPPVNHGRPMDRDEIAAFLRKPPAELKGITGAGRWLFAALARDCAEMRALFIASPPEFEVVMARLARPSTC